jgi:hypothetical protein
MIGQMRKNKTRSPNRGNRKTREFAGIRSTDKGRNPLKTKSAQLRQILMAWDCSVLYLLHSGPRIYTGSL